MVFKIFKKKAEEPLPLHNVSLPDNTEKLHHTLQRKVDKLHAKVISLEKNSIKPTLPETSVIEKTHLDSLEMMGKKIQALEKSIERIEGALKHIDSSHAEVVKTLEGFTTFQQTLGEHAQILDQLDGLPLNMGTLNETVLKITDLEKAFMESVKDVKSVEETIGAHVARLEDIDNVITAIKADIETFKKYEPRKLSDEFVNFVKQKIDGLEDEVKRLKDPIKTLSTDSGSLRMKIMHQESALEGVRGEVNALENKVAGQILSYHDAVMQKQEMPVLEVKALRGDLEEMAVQIGTIASQVFDLKSQVESAYTQRDTNKNVEQSLSKEKIESNETDSKSGNSMSIAPVTKDSTKHQEELIEPVENAEEAPELDDLYKIVEKKKATKDGNRLQAMIDSVEMYLKEGDIKAAADAYQEIKSAFDGFPAHIQKKYYTQVVDLYHEIMGKIFVSS